jgi:hypothetical protein
VKVTLGATKAITVPCKHDRKNSYYGFTANLPRPSLAGGSAGVQDVLDREHESEIEAAEDFKLDQRNDLD